jgi:hypothetical protein
MHCLVIYQYSYVSDIGNTGLCVQMRHKNAANPMF